MYDATVSCSGAFLEHLNSRTDQSRAEQSRSEQSRAEQSTSKQSRAEQSTAEHSRAEECRAEQSRGEQSRAAAFSFLFTMEGIYFCGSQHVRNGQIGG